MKFEIKLVLNYLNIKTNHPKTNKSMHPTNKKIPIMVIISSCALLIYSMLAKEYQPTRYTVFLSEKNMDIPKIYYFIKVIGIQLPFLKVIFILIASLALGVYWYIQKTDEQIKSGFQKFKMYVKTKLKGPK